MQLNESVEENEVCQSGPLSDPNASIPAKPLQPIKEESQDVK